jgi:hypothetical protein
VAGLVLYHATAKGTRSSDYPCAPSDEEHASWIEQIRARWGQTEFAAADLRPSSATTVVRGELGRFRGRELDTAGDGFFAGTS